MHRQLLGIAILVLFVGTHPGGVSAQNGPQGPALTPLPQSDAPQPQSVNPQSQTVAPQAQNVVPQVQYLVPQGSLPPGIGVGGYVYGPTVATQQMAAPPVYVGSSVVVPGYPYTPYSFGGYPAYPYAGGYVPPYGVNGVYQYPSIYSGLQGPVPYGAPYGGPPPYGYPYYGPYPFNNAVIQGTRQENARQWGSPFPPVPVQTPLVQRPIRESSPQAKQRSLHFIAQGDIWFRKQNYLQAYARYKNAATEAPDLAIPHFRLGLTLTAQRRFESAVAEIKRGLALDRSWAVTGDSLDELFGEDNQLAKASLMHVVAEWAKADVRDPERLFLLGVLLHFNDEAERASTVFTTAAKLANSPDHVMAFLYPPPAPGAKPAPPSDRDTLPGASPTPPFKYLYPTDPERSRARPAIPDPEGPRPEAFVPEPRDVPARASEPAEPPFEPDVASPATKPQSGPRIPNPSAQLPIGIPKLLVRL